MIGRGPLIAVSGFVGCAGTLLCVAFADSSVARDVFDGIRTSATVTVAAVGVWVAFQGLQTWRRQLYGTSRFDACRKLLAATLALRDEFPRLRHPMQIVSPNDGEDPNVAARRQNIERFNAAFEKLQACETEKTSVEVLMGAKAVEPFAELRRIVADIRWALHLESMEGTQAFATFFDERMGILYETNLPRSEAFTKRIADAIAQIDSTLGSVVRQRP